jgi:phosphatidate cytidylyltransferase
LSSVQTRVFSSFFVVLIGLLPALIGGPAIALLLIGLGLAGYIEYLKLILRRETSEEGLSLVGAATIIVLALAALLDVDVTALYTIVGLSVAIPFVSLLRAGSRAGSVNDWALATLGSLGLGLSIFAAIALRSQPGTVDAAWLAGLAGDLAFGWPASPRGLAWVLLVVVTTWINDSAAYLVGRAVGRHPLAPALSPRKTVEGASAGMVGALLTGGICFPAFGLGTWWIGAVVGGVLGVAAQIGDLAESALKRQAGVKDSGSLIPGHGGILDRIDGLLFAFPTGFVLAAGLERLGL